MAQTNKDANGKQINARCQVDEFPMGALKEARNLQPQFVRLVNGEANGRQGNDFEAWRSAVWEPCSKYKKEICKSKDPEPPITWEFGTYTAGDPRESAASAGSHFIQKYGVSYGPSRVYATGVELICFFCSGIPKLPHRCAGVSYFAMMAFRN